MTSRTNKLCCISRQANYKQGVAASEVEWSFRLQTMRLQGLGTTGELQTNYVTGHGKALLYDVDTKEQAQRRMIKRKKNSGEASAATLSRISARR